MTSSISPDSNAPTTLDESYSELLRTLSDGSVHRRFDPYLDIDWESPEFAIDPEDPRWVLQECDPIGCQPWYQNLPLDRKVEIGMWRQANVTKVGSAFESILIRGMMQYIMKLPNGSPEFRYCLHEMTEECNHIQMFQEFVNRMGVDVPGMRLLYRVTSPLWGPIAGYLPVIFFIGILAGEEPIDHAQKDVIRLGNVMPPVLLRTMEIHIAEEARHISFAHRFLREHIAMQGQLAKAGTSILYPLIMRWLAGVIMVPPRSFEKKFDIPRDVMKDAFWRSPQSRDILSGYFGDVRLLADELGLMNPATRAIWKFLHIDGRSSRYRSEPHRS